VDAVSFRPPTSDTTARVVIQMTVRKRDAQLITRDSRAEVRSGATIISPMVVYITPGTPTVSRVANDDTLRAGAQSDFAVAVDKVKAATQEIDPIMTDARTVLRSVHSSNGTVGALLAGGITGRGDVAELRRRISALRATMSGAGMGRGARSRTELFAEVRVALARADSVRTLIASPNSSFGRFRRDSTLFATIASVRDDLSAVRAAMDSADGTLARVASDSALMRSVADARREMSALFDDLRRRPLRYINLF
jgi:hypothetical protein